MQCDVIKFFLKFIISFWLSLLLILFNLFLLHSLNSSMCKSSYAREEEKIGTSE